MGSGFMIFLLKPVFMSDDAGLCFKGAAFLGNGLDDLIDCLFRLVVVTLFIIRDVGTFIAGDQGLVFAPFNIFLDMS